MSRVVIGLKLTAFLCVCLTITGCRVFNFFDEVSRYSEVNIADLRSDCRTDCEPEPYSGLGRYWRIRNRHDVRNVARKCCESAWDQYCRQCRQSPSKHFKNGFHDAFFDIADGGDGKVPPIPPKKYWNAYYRSPEGKVYAQQWFNGFRVGAAMAFERGLDRMNEIATSIESCGCGGSGCPTCSPGHGRTSAEFGPTISNGFWQSPAGTLQPTPGFGATVPHGSTIIPEPGTRNSLAPTPDSRTTPYPSSITPTPQPFPTTIPNGATPSPNGGTMGTVPFPFSNPTIPRAGQPSIVPGPTGTAPFIPQPPNLTPSPVPFPLPTGPNPNPNPATPAPTTGQSIPSARLNPVTPTGHGSRQVPANAWPQFHPTGQMPAPQAIYYPQPVVQPGQGSISQHGFSSNTGMYVPGPNQQWQQPPLGWSQQQTWMPPPNAHQQIPIGHSNAQAVARQPGMYSR